MTEPQTITTDHLRTLLAADDAEARIGLVGGAVEVIDADQRDSEQYRGALDVISRGELEDRLGGAADEDRLRAQAEALTEAVLHLGG